MTPAPQPGMTVNERATDQQGAQYLTFVLAGEDYAVGILRVQEIRGWERATRVPNTPAYVSGVLNLRGTIVPLIDVRLRFGLDPAEHTRENVVIVVRVGGDDHERSVGLIVDAVSDVLVVADDQVGTTPEFGDGVPTDSIRGLVPDGEKMVMLLDIESLCATGDVADLPPGDNVTSGTRATAETDNTGVLTVADGRHAPATEES